MQIPVPYTVPVTVERHVDVPVTVDVHDEVPVPVTVQKIVTVPRPYPVTRVCAQVVPVAVLAAKKPVLKCTATFDIKGPGWSASTTLQSVLNVGS